MIPKESLIKALIAFYEKIVSGMKPTEILILRLSKEYKVERAVLTQYINKINRQLISERIDSSWNMKEKIEEIVDPERRRVSSYTEALKELSKLAPDVTTFEVKKIIFKHDLNRIEKEKLRNQAQKLRGNIYRSSNPKKSRLDKAKKKLKKEFLKNPNSITKEKLKRIANDYNITSAELIKFYKENYKDWTKTPEEANTIQEILN